MNIVVAIGNSAAGKSTMLTSLIYGADVLVLKKIQDQREGPGGKLVNYTQDVIDQTDEFKKQMEEKS